MPVIQRSIIYILLLTLITLFVSCGGAARYKKIKLPKEPRMLPVKVKNRTIKGKSLDNVITNHINSWKYIKELQKLGNFKK